MSDASAKKEERRKFQAIKGARDILPPESALWNRVEQTAREVFATYGFGEIRLPIFEQTELFARSVGEHTDIVSKEMYAFEDHDHADLGRLRSSLLLWEPWQPSFEDANSFTKQLKTFLQAFQRIYEAGKVPRTSDNEWSLERLLELLEEIEEGVERLQTSNNFKGRAKEMFIREQVLEEGLGKFESWAGSVKHLLQAIKLGDNVTLRPEATASVVRAYIEHGMQTLPGNVKLYYVGPMFRRERPQKGRYRQFYQIGAEVLSHSGGLIEDARVDAEVIEMLMKFFARVGLTQTTLHVNSIGHSAPECRRGYIERLRAELVRVKDQLGADSQRRIDTNPLRVLDSRLPNEQEIIAKLPHIADHLCADCRKHYAELHAQLALREIAYEENWRLVRGLDYYMRTTFEITAPGLGAQNAVCGGGRYDGLVELLGGPPTKGIGFAIGTDRLVLSLQETLASSQALPANAPTAIGTGGIDVYVAWLGDAAYPAAVRIARLLREAGLRVELPPGDAKLGKSLGLADKLGAKYAVIVGDNEVASGEFVVKRLADSEQKKVREGELIEHLRN